MVVKERKTAKKIKIKNKIKKVERNLNPRNLNPNLNQKNQRNLENKFVNLYFN